jgi:RNA polymerase sigma-70 factor (ECF subfamily)
MKHGGTDGPSITAVEPAMSRGLTLAAGQQMDAEDALIVQAQADPKLFGEVYQRYLARIYRYLRTLTATNEDASDLTQVVFIKAMAALPGYRPGRGPFAAWLFRIARNAATDAHRRRRPAVPLDVLAGTAAEPEAESLDAEVLRRERLRRLQAALSQLDPGKRDLIALRFAAGLSVREIAAVVGKRQEAVKKQLYRTIASLKENYVD